ncbi:MAG: thiol-disulfide isomerase-like thioredoxin [Flaviaesturariibacter sp.]|nr:thiol-disulfide isomerase-like thioredoxin [Flaviaesturariibacter sp.]
MKHHLAVMVILLPLLSVAQTGKGQVEPLTIGQALPPELRSRLLRVAAPLRSTDLQKDLLILDFWSPSCGSCLTAFPLINSLSRQYGAWLQVVAITEAPAGRVRSVFAGRKALQGLGLPSVTDDTLFRQYFPHVMVPHLVWIDGGGTIRAITGGEYLTVPNIVKVLRHGFPPGWPVKRDVQDWDPARPLLVANNGGVDGRFLYRSLITPHITGLPARMERVMDTAVGTVRLVATNATVPELYALAFPGAANWPRSRRLWEGVTPQTFIPPTDPDSLAAWRDANLYCYELTLPVGREGDMNRTLAQDLDRFFSLRGRIERRSLTCSVLVRTDTAVNVKSRGGKPAHNLGGEGPKFLRNRPLSMLLSYLGAHSLLPVIDQTGVRGGVDLELPPNLYDSSTLAKALAAKGLALVQKVCDIDVFVLSATPSGPKPLGRPEVQKPKAADRLPVATNTE